MLSRPVLKRLYDFPRAFQYIQATLRQERTYSLVKMTTPAKWKIEKNRILNMTFEDKRKHYKLSGYVAVDSVDPWRNYVIRDKNVETKKHTLDDVKEYQKHVFNPDLDKELSEKVAVFRGDITKLEVDAIVNAANAALRRGGGVDGAIHRAAGPLLQEECNSLHGCQTGDAKVSGGYGLPAKYVIHTVGPQDGSAAALKSCYERCLSHHQEYKLKSFAFPCISTGIYGFPNRKAAHIALSTTRKFLESNPKVEKVIFCTFLPIDVEVYETLMQMYFPLHANNYNEGASATER